MQQADPSSGWAQQAPLFSSGLLLGVQQEVAEVETGVQHEEPVTVAFVTVAFVFSKTGMFAICVSIVKLFIYIDGNTCIMMQLFVARIKRCWLATIFLFYFQHISAVIQFNRTAFQKNLL